MKNKLKYGQLKLILIVIEGCFDFDASYFSARYSVWCQAKGEIIGNRSIIDAPFQQTNGSYSTVLSFELCIAYFLFVFLLSKLNQAKTEKVPE